MSRKELTKEEIEKRYASSVASKLEQDTFAEELRKGSSSAEAHRIAAAKRNWYALGLIEI